MRSINILAFALVLGLGAAPGAQEHEHGGSAGEQRTPTLRPARSPDATV